MASTPTPILEEMIRDIQQKIKFFADREIILGPALVSEIGDDLSSHTMDSATALQASLNTQYTHYHQVRLGNRATVSLLQANSDDICDAIWKQGLNSVEDYQKLKKILPFQHSAHQLANDLARAEVLYTSRAGDYRSAPFYQKPVLGEANITELLKKNRLVARVVSTSLGSYQSFLKVYEDYSHQPDPPLRVSESRDKRKRILLRTSEKHGAAGQVVENKSKSDRDDIRLRTARDASKKFSMTFIPRSGKLALLSRGGGSIGIFFDAEKLEIRGRFHSNPVTHGRSWVGASEAEVREYLKDHAYLDTQHKEFLERVNSSGSWTEILAKFNRDSIQALFITDDKPSKDLVRESLNKLKTIRKGRELPDQELQVIIWDATTGEMRVYSRQEQWEDEHGINLLKDLSSSAMSTNPNLVDSFHKLWEAVEDDCEPAFQKFFLNLREMYDSTETKENAISFLQNFKRPIKTAENSAKLETLYKMLHEHCQPVVKDALKREYVSLEKYIKHPYLNFQSKQDQIRESHATKSKAELMTYVASHSTALCKQMLSEIKAESTTQRSWQHEVTWTTIPPRTGNSVLEAEFSTELNSYSGENLKNYILLKLTNKLDEILSITEFNAFKERLEASKEYQVLWEKRSRIDPRETDSISFLKILLNTKRLELEEANRLSWDPEDNTKSYLIGNHSITAAQINDIKGDALKSFILGKISEAIDQCSSSEKIETMKQAIESSPEGKIVRDQYEFLLIPDEDRARAIKHNTIYYSDSGDFIVRDLRGVVREGTVPGGFLIPTTHDIWSLGDFKWRKIFAPDEVQRHLIDKGFILGYGDRNTYDAQKVLDDLYLKKQRKFDEEAQAKWKPEDASKSLLTTRQVELLNLPSDALKPFLMKCLREHIEAFKNLEELNAFAQRFKDSSEYSILNEKQTTYKTPAIEDLERSIEAKRKELQEEAILPWREETGESSVLTTLFLIEKSLFQDLKGKKLQDFIFATLSEKITKIDDREILSTLEDNFQSSTEYRVLNTKDGVNKSPEKTALVEELNNLMAKRRDELGEPARPDVSG